MKTEMKDSGIDWIGEIPKHWEAAKLKNVLWLKTGTTPKLYEDKNEFDELINWYTPSDVSEDGNIILSSERKLAKRVLDLEHISLYPNGSIMFVGIGALAGKVGYAIDSGYSNQQITALIPKGTNGKFYYYFLLADKQRIRDNAFFTTLPIINNGYLGQVKVLLPPKEEQSRIANFLDKKCAEIDELIALQEQMIAQLTTYKQAVITETVTKGLDPNVKMKDSGVEWIGEIPEHWEVKRLKQESIFINGYAFDSEDFKLDDGVKVIRIGDIGLKADFENCVRAVTNVNILIPYRIKDGDILIAMSGATTGKSCFVEKSEEAYINQRVGIIRSKIRKVIYYSLQTPYFMEFVNLKNFGSAQPNISSKAIGEFPIIVMPDLEQQSIANYLDQKCKEIDELISIKKEKIEQLKAYKKSVIYEYVTGKKQVEIDSSVHTN